MYSLLEARGAQYLRKRVPWIPGRVYDMGIVATCPSRSCETSLERVKSPDPATDHFGASVHEMDQAAARCDDTSGRAEMDDDSEFGPLAGYDFVLNISTPSRIQVDDRCERFIRHAAVVLLVPTSEQAVNTIRYFMAKTYAPGSKLVEGDSSSGEFMTSTTCTPGSDGARFHHIIPSAAMLQVTHALTSLVVNLIPLPGMILFPGHLQSVRFGPSRHWLTMGMEVTMVLDPDPGHGVEMGDVNALGFSDVVHDMKEADFQVALSWALLALVILSGVQVAAAHACNSSHLFHDGTDNVGIIPPPLLLLLLCPQALI